MGDEGVEEYVRPTLHTDMEDIDQDDRHPARRENYRVRGREEKSMRTINRRREARKTIRCCLTLLHAQGKLV